MKTLFLIISMVVLTQAQNTSEADGHRATTPTATSATPSTTQSAQPTRTSSTPSRTSTIRASRSSTTVLSTSSATTQTDTFITSTPGPTDSSTDTVGSTSPTLSQSTGLETTTTSPAGPETTTTSTEVPPQPMQDTSPPTTTTTDESPPSATTEESNTWLIVGVSVGVLLLVIVIIIIIVIVVCVYRRKKKVVKEPLIKPEPARIPTYITNPRVQKKPKPPPHGYRATGPNAPYHYEAKDFHWRGPAKFDTRPIGIEDLPEPSSNETALSYHSDEHVEFDKDLNEVYEIGSEVEEYLDRPNPRNKLKKSKSKESSGRHDPNKAVIER